MGKVLNLNNYRVRRQREWLEKYRGRLESYLSHRLLSHISWSFAQVAHSYQSNLHFEFEESWDYLDLREHLEDELRDLAQQVHNDLACEYWFDRKAISVQKLTEFCLDIFISGSAGLSA